MTKIKINLIALILTAFIGTNSQVCAQSNLESEVDKLAKTILDSLTLVPGFAVGLVQNGEVVFKKGYGYSNVFAKQPFTVNSEFYIASTTKSFTALSAVILSRKGKLDLDKSLHEYFPDFHFPDSIQADKINIRHLLSHTSGLDNSHITYRLSQSGDYSFAELFDFLSNETFGRVKLGEYRYSNLGYNILNLIYLKEYGKTWKQIVQEEILNPLGMTHTYTSLSDVLKNKEEIITGYYSLGNGIELLQEHQNVKISDKTLHAAGGLFSTLNDVTKWLELQTAPEDNFKFKNILPQDLQETRIQRAQFESGRFGLAKHTFGYGLGWSIGEIRGYKIYYHGGSYGGYKSMISYIPELKAGIVTLTNDAVTGNSLNYSILDFIYGQMANNKSIQSETYERAYEWVSKYKKELEVGLVHAKKDYENRKGRKFNLTVNIDEITGIYFNEEGEYIRIYEEENELTAYSGDLKGSIEPYIDTNTLRLHLLDPNILSLDVRDGKVEGFTYFNTYYKKL